MVSIPYSPLKLHVGRRKSIFSRFIKLILYLFVLGLIAFHFLPNFTQQISGDYPRLLKRPEVAHIDCARILGGDIVYAKNQISRQILVPTPSHKLDMSCEAVRERVLSRRNPHTGFPISFVKVVNQGYEFLEEQLAVTYSEENTYCFAIDKKASISFRRNFLGLSICLPNVLLSEKEYDTDSNGHYQTEAQFDCLRVIKKRNWNYVIMLQNHDIVIKTNQEIVSMLKALDGANDMEMSKCPGDNRCEIREKNLGKLGLCPKHLNTTEYNKCARQQITMAKGWAQVTLTHESVDFLLDKINLTRFRNELNGQYYGMDELFIQSIAATRALNMPGMYPARCLHDNDTPAPSNRLFMTRLTHWIWWRMYGCGSGIWRHNICVFGVEDLPYLASVHHIMANKMLPTIDYGAISCIGELLFNRTHYELEDHPLDMSIYENLPMVQLRKGMRKDPSFFDKFVCPKFPKKKPKPIIQAVKDFIMNTRS